MLENELHDSEPSIDEPEKSRSSGVADAPAAAAAPRARTTRRRTAKSAAKSATTAEAAQPTADAPAAADTGETPAARPARRTRRTASRAAGPPAAEAQPTADGPGAGTAQPAEAGQSAGAGQAAGAGQPAEAGHSAEAGPTTETPGQSGAADKGRSGATRTRTRRTRTTKASAAPADGEGGRAESAEPARSARASGTGKTASGPGQDATGGASQAGAVVTPFAAPFAAPAAPPAQPAGGEPGSGTRPGQAEQPSAVPAATFQPPQAIFQQPAPPPPAPAPAREPARDAAPAGETSAEQDDTDAEGGSRRRRRRGSRSRSRTPEAEPGQDSSPAADAATGAQPDAGAEAPAPAAKADSPAEAADTGADDDETTTGGSRRRRRKRRRGSAADTDQAGPDDPPNTVVHVRPGRAGSEDHGDEVQMVRGSTRLEAKRQRRKEGRDSGRRRPPVITESEFLARREAVDRVMVVRQRGDWTQIAVLEDGVLVEHYVDRGSHQSLVGNVYLGKVQNVLPSMEAAFVDIGKGRNAVLYAGEVNFDASGLEGESKRIESALKSGQSVLVQVTKDPVGHKGARLTSQASLPGRYLVYVPGGSMMGISRKLPDTERTRLKQILKQVMPENAGVIVRTAAEGASEEELAHDVARLSAQWESIERKAKSASPPE